jgi:ribonucleoside-diphosphate reductase alpha chain
VAEKIIYWTQDGSKTLYLIISFMTVQGVADGKPIKLERAIEFFMPVGQNGESQQWITSSMRLLSLAARGGFLARALHDMRKVAWDRGPVRLGTMQKENGTQVPMWHDSEVAAVAYAIEQIIARRSSSSPGIADAESDPGNAQSAAVFHPQQMQGKKCPECGAHAMIKKDGCEYCTHCGHIGSCG